MCCVVTTKLFLSHWEQNNEPKLESYSMTWKKQTRCSCNKQSAFKNSREQQLHITEAFVIGIYGCMRVTRILWAAFWKLVQRILIAFVIHADNSLRRVGGIRIAAGIGRFLWSGIRFSRLLVKGDAITPTFEGRGNKKRGDNYSWRRSIYYSCLEQLASVQILMTILGGKEMAEISRPGEGIRSAGATKVQFWCEGVIFLSFCNNSSFL